METLMTDPLLDNINMSKSESNKSALNLLKCKCPRCRQGDMFQDKNPWRLKNTMKMNKECPVCGQPLDIEVGFYFGSSYVSYALSVALCVATFLAWWVLIRLQLIRQSYFLLVSIKCNIVSCSSTLSDESVTNRMACLLCAR